jgi:hypothetical protein
VEFEDDARPEIGGACMFFMSGLVDDGGRGILQVGSDRSVESTLARPPTAHLPIDLTVLRALCFQPDHPHQPAALALLLFGSTSTELPGGYSSKELSAESPLRAIKGFPEELVMLGRATVIIKVWLGLTGRLGV